MMSILQYVCEEQLLSQIHLGEGDIILLNANKTVVYQKETSLVKMKIHNDEKNSIIIETFWYHQLLTQKQTNKQTNAP